MRPLSTIDRKQDPGSGPESFPRQYFRRALEKGRLSHAYLFVGPQGSGRKRLALDLARAIFCAGDCAGDGTGDCAGDGAGGSARGSCSACAALEHGNHPGLFVYGPEEGKSSVEIAAIRELSARIHLRRADFLVAILEEADRMSVPAANALLKTLEEPTGSSLLILLARSAGSLLPTIVSRCHRLTFRSRPEEEPGRPGEAAAAGGPPPELDGCLEESRRAGFLALNDPREWLARAIPGQESSRQALAILLEALIRRERAAWDPGAGGDTDLAARRLEELIDLRADLERNVNPDLLLEGSLRLLSGR